VETIFFGVQSIDAAFEGSSFSAESQAFVIGIHGSKGACLNSEYSYTAQPLGNYTWTVAGGTILSGQGTNSIVINWHTLGDAYVAISNAQGDRNTLPVKVEEVPNPVIEGDLTVCTGAQTYINNDPLSYHSVWTISDENSTVSALVNAGMVEWVSAGEFNLIIKSSPEHKGCFAYDTVRVLVDQRPTAAIDGPGSGCVSQLERYESTSAKTEWRVTNGVLEAKASEYIDVRWASQPGNGSVWLKQDSEHGYCSAKDSLQVVINDRPLKPYLRLLNDTIVLASESPSGFYRWYFNNEVVVEGPYIGVIPDVSGSVAVEVFNWEGCGNKSDSLIYYVSDDINDIKIFPNPADQYVAIEWTSKNYNDLEVFIYSSSNILLKKFTVQKPWATIVERLDISDLIPGILYSET
jgi:hypothetical protein